MGLRSHAFVYLLIVDGYDNDVYHDEDGVDDNQSYLHLLGSVISYLLDGFLRVVQDVIGLVPLHIQGCGDNAYEIGCDVCQESVDHPIFVVPYAWVYQSVDILYSSHQNYYQEREIDEGRHASLIHLGFEEDDHIEKDKNRD